MELLGGEGEFLKVDASLEELKVRVQSNQNSQHKDIQMKYNVEVLKFLLVAVLMIQLYQKKARHFLNLKSTTNNFYLVYP